MTFKICTVQLGDVRLPLLVDTGTAASLLNLSTYNKFFAHLPLQLPPIPLLGYDSSRIGIVGVLQIQVRDGSKHIPAFPFHIAKRDANLLGFDLFTDLRFSLHDNSGSPIHQVTSTWEQKWPALFDGRGCLTAFTHRPLMNTLAPPVIQPLRRIPLY